MEREYDSELVLRSCGISIGSNFTQAEGRVLPAPRLKVGNGEDFFPCNGKWNFNNKGTTRLMHYHVLYDEVGFSADDLQELVHSLSHVYQRSTTAISVVAPLCYAHLATTWVRQFMKFDKGFGTLLSHGDTSAGPVPVP